MAGGSPGRCAGGRGWVSGVTTGVGRAGRDRSPEPEGGRRAPGAPAGWVCLRVGASGSGRRWERAGRRWETAGSVVRPAIGSICQEGLRRGRARGRGRARAMGLIECVMGVGGIWPAGGIWVPRRGKGMPRSRVGAGGDEKAKSADERGRRGRRRARHGTGSAKGRRV